MTQSFLIWHSSGFVATSTHASQPIATIAEGMPSRGIRCRPYAHGPEIARARIFPDFRTQIFAMCKIEVPPHGKLHEAGDFFIFPTNGIGAALHIKLPLAIYAGDILFMLSLSVEGHHHQMLCIKQSQRITSKE